MSYVQGAKYNEQRTRYNLQVANKQVANKQMKHCLLEYSLRSCLLAFLLLGGFTYFC